MFAIYLNIVIVFCCIFVGLHDSYVSPVVTYLIKGRWCDETLCNRDGRVFASTNSSKSGGMPPVSGVGACHEYILVYGLSIS